MYDYSPPKKRPTASSGTTEPISAGGTAAKEATKDLIETIAQDIQKQSAAVSEMGGKVTELSKTVGENKQKADEVAAQTMARIADMQAMIDAQKSNTGSTQISTAETIKPEKIDELFEGQEPAAVNPPPPPAPKKTAIISPGDSVRMELLAGVNAPTAGNPYPVVFKLASDVTGPDGSQLPLGEARIVGGAVGSLTDHRAIIKLISLSYRAPNGSRGEVKIEGWVVGEDGVVGLEGEMIDPLGKVIAAQAMAGVIQGAGSAVSQGQSNGALDSDNAFITGDTATYAAGQGVNQAGTALSQAIKQRADQMVPQVRVLSGRTATAVFSSSVEIPGLYDLLEEQSEGNGSAQFVNLD